MDFYDGVINKWEGDESVSHVVQMLRDGFRAAAFFDHSLFVLDRYFLTVPMLMEWKKKSAQHSGLLHIITRVKKNCTAYEKPIRGCFLMCDKSDWDRYKIRYESSLPNVLNWKE